MTKKIRDWIYRVEVSWFQRYRKYNGPNTVKQAKKDGYKFSTHFNVLAYDVPDAIEQVKKIKIIEYVDRSSPSPIEITISSEELMFDEVKHICTLKMPKKYNYHDHHRSKF